MTAQVYEVMTKISMVNGVSAVLATVGKDVLQLEGSISKLSGSLAGLDKVGRAVAGGLAAIGGVAVLSGPKSVAEHGDKLLDQQDKLQRAGVSLNEVLRLQTGFYEKLAGSFPTATAAEYLKTFNELRSVVGANEAEAIALFSMKLESIIANATGKSAEGEGFKLWRALEMTGRSISDPAGTQKLADAFAKNIIGSGGKLDANVYQTMAKRGGVAWAHADPRFLAGPMSVVAADLGGDTAGTALMSLFQLTSGAVVMSKQQAEVLQRIGMLDPNKVHHVAGSERLNIEPGAMLGWQEAIRDPYSWVNKTLMPHMNAAYDGDRNQIESAIAKLGRNRNVTRMLTMFSDPGFLEQINKDLSQWEQAHSIDRSYADFISRNPLGVRAAFNSQYESMMMAIGAPIMQASLPVMRSVTSMFEGIGAFSNAHPRLIADLGKGFAILGSAAVTSGLGLLVGGLGGGLIGAFAGAVGALVALNWPQLNTGLAGFVGKLAGRLADALQAVVGWLDKLSRGIDAVAGAIASALEKIMSWASKLAGAISAIGGFFSKINYQGAGFGSGGIINASYGDMGAERGQVADYIRKAAIARGIDPNVALRVAASEGLHRYVGDSGSSFGPFQLHYGGIAGGGNAVDGLGDVFTKRTGLNARDRSTWKSQVDFALDHAKKHGWGAWHGWKGHPRAGLGGFAPPRRGGGQMVQIHSHVNVDGRELARATTTHVARLHQHSTQAPYFDGIGMFAGPDAQFAVG